MKKKVIICIGIFLILLLLSFGYIKLNEKSKNDSLNSDSTNQKINTQGTNKEEDNITPELSDENSTEENSIQEDKMPANQQENSTNSSSKPNNSTNSSTSNNQSNTTTNKPSSSNNQSNNNSSNNSSNPSTNTGSSTTPEEPDTPPKQSEEKPKSIEEKVNETLSKMTLDEKITQMFIVSYDGSTMTTSLKNMLTTYKPGGFILFSYNKNITTYNNTLNLVNNIQNTAKIPMFISIDQEGGIVQRLTALSSPSATYIPSMTLLGKTNNTNLSYKVGQVMGEELRTLGINMNFAPVIDVMDNETTSVMKNRSFGTDPEKVANMGISLAKGLKSKEVIPVYKHFPGHGGTSTDSHYDLPVLNKTKDELKNTDLIPFQKAIDNGADVIMIGHLSIPKIDSNYPSSLSKAIITDLLKNEMGFKGLVITDALNMGALAKNFNEKEIYELAINAGVDILLMPKSPSSALQYIKQSINEGRIKESQITNSVKKILTIKYSSLPSGNLSKDYLGSQQHKNIVAQIPSN